VAQLGAEKVEGLDGVAMTGELGTLGAWADLRLDALVQHRDTFVDHERDAEVNGVRELLRVLD